MDKDRMGLKGKIIFVKTNDDESYLTSNFEYDFKTGKFSVFKKEYNSKEDCPEEILNYVMESFFSKSFAVMKVIEMEVFKQYIIKPTFKDLIEFLDYLRNNIKEEVYNEPSFRSEKIFDILDVGLYSLGYSIEMIFDYINNGKVIVFQYKDWLNIMMNEPLIKDHSKFDELNPQKKFLGLYVFNYLKDKFNEPILGGIIEPQIAVYLFDLMKVGKIIQNKLLDIFVEMYKKKQSEIEVFDGMKLTIDEIEEIVAMYKVMAMNYLIRKFGEKKIFEYILSLLTEEEIKKFLKYEYLYEELEEKRKVYHKTSRDEAVVLFLHI